VSNQLETLLLVPALLGARLLAARYGKVAFAAVAVLSLLTIAENQLGSDGGGAIVVGVGFAVLAVTMAGAGWRLIVPALGAAALGVRDAVAARGARGVAARERLARPGDDRRLRRGGGARGRPGVPAADAAGAATARPRRGRRLAATAGVARGRVRPPPAGARG